MIDKRPVRLSVLIVFLFLSALTTLSTSLSAQSPNRAGLVVQFDAGSYITRCVEFDEAQFTGYDLLLRAGLEVEAYVSAGMGALLCGIQGVGCPITNCMCDFPPNYWSYWHLAGEDWIYSQAGVTGYILSPGDVEGWTWGEGNPPPVISFEEICAPPATDTPTPTPTSTPSPTLTSTDTPTPTPTWTPAPTHTRTPILLAATPLPTATPLPSATATSVPAPTGTPAATAAAARTHTPAPAPTTGPSHTPPTAVQASEPPISPTTAASPTLVEQAPGPSPSATPSETSVASVTPVPTRLAVATHSSAAKGLVATVATIQPTGASKGMASLPILLTAGAALTYVLFVLFVFLLAAVYIVARLRQRGGETPGG